jgi:hemerythrin-like domain-containing protein
MQGVSVALPGHQAPTAGFEQPFVMLAACHDRVVRSLQLLRRLLDHIDAAGVDADARAAARDVWRYFEIAAPAHHADEELHVLPRLRAAGDPWLADVARRIDADHAELRLLWQQLGPLLLQLHEAEPRHITMTSGAMSTLRPLAAAFIALHERHLPLEDSFAFPAALAGMQSAELQAMGEEMQRRRAAAARSDAPHGGGLKI